MKCIGKSHFFNDIELLLVEHAPTKTTNIHKLAQNMTTKACEIKFVFFLLELKLSSQSKSWKNDVSDLGVCFIMYLSRSQQSFT